MTKKKGGAKKKTSKKAIRKKTVHHKTEHHAQVRHPHDIHVEKVLVENFVNLQKVMTNLSVKFDSLSTQISKLLELFEISAKTMAQKDFELGGKKDEEMMKKIDSLLDQNKIIARGLTLLHEPETPSMIPPQKPISQPGQMIPRQIPPMPGTAQTIPARPMMQQPLMKQNAVEENESNINVASYQKSQHIDESQNVNFDIGRNNKEENKDEFAI